MEHKLCTTLKIISNLQPVSDRPLNDKIFLSFIRDPMALEILNEMINKKRTDYHFSAIQNSEFQNASLHCALADIGDYPWGTVSNEGNERVVCKCLNYLCVNFEHCRGQLENQEINLIEENVRLREVNKQISWAIYTAKHFQNTIPNENSVKTVLAAETFVESTQADLQISRTIPEYNSSNDLEPSDKDVINSSNQEKLNVDASSSTESEIIKIGALGQNEQRDELGRETVTQKNNQSSLTLSVPDGSQNTPANLIRTDFSKFLDTSQDEVINCDHLIRTVVNAGPGTGKTWALIHKIIHMVMDEKIDPESILILCFSHAAIDVIESRLRKAADSDQIGLNWHSIEIRTFDSFATCLLAWTKENVSNCLPHYFNIEALNYEQRIEQAVNVLAKKKDMFAQYSHIIVDEVQDLVSPRADLIMQILKILPEGCGFTLFGDSCQSVYDYQVKDDPKQISSARFYQWLFNEFPKINYCEFLENHRQVGAFASLTTEYRKLILNGSEESRSSEASRLYHNILSSESLNLKVPSQSDISKLCGNGTVGILTRKNGEALQISTWFRNENIPHIIQRPISDNYLAGWIGRVFRTYNNEIMTRKSFEETFEMLYPNSSSEKMGGYWEALESTQTEKKDYYEISALLRGVLTNSKDSRLFAGENRKDSQIVISNIHRAKGKEFDSVIVLDDLLNTAANENSKDINEHKVAYVALTRPRKNIFKANPTKMYIYTDKQSHRRCYQAGFAPKGRNKPLSHIEIGYSDDIDPRFFAKDQKIQNIISNIVLGSRVILKLNRTELVYNIVLEENNSIFGITSPVFTMSLENSIKNLNRLPYHVALYDRLYPTELSDVYVDDLVTYLSTDCTNKPGAKIINDICIWNGISIIGFAQVERSRY